MPVECGAQVCYGALADKVHEDRLGIAARALDNVDDDNCKGHPAQHRQVFLDKDIVQSGLDDEGEGGVQAAADEHAEKGDHESPPVWFRQSYESSINVH